VARRDAPEREAAPKAEEIAGLQVVADAVIYRHVFGSSDREVGGVLVGRLAATGGLPLVTGAIPALSADEQRATLTFTQDAWAHVHRVLEAEFPPDEQIVGWYHSHPGFGIFLSTHDLFIHEHFFGAPSQIAVVVDPHARREGVFAWRDEALAPVLERETPGGWTASTVRQPPVPLPETFAVSDATPPSRDEPRPWLGVLVAALLGLAIGFGLWTFADGTGSTHHSRRAPAHAARHPGTSTSPPVQNDVEVLQR
jgi:proteasome lid subunit RPN8/RPN11